MSLINNILVAFSVLVFLIILYGCRAMQRSVTIGNMPLFVHGLTWFAFSIIGVVLVGFSSIVVTH